MGSNGTFKHITLFLTSFKELVYATVIILLLVIQCKSIDYVVMNISKSSKM